MEFTYSHLDFSYGEDFFIFKWKALKVTAIPA